MPKERRATTEYFIPTTQNCLDSWKRWSVNWNAAQRQIRRTTELSDRRELRKTELCQTKFNHQRLRRFDPVSLFGGRSWLSDVKHRMAQSR